MTSLCCRLLMWSFMGVLLNPAPSALKVIDIRKAARAGRRGPLDAQILGGKNRALNLVGLTEVSRP